jgi:hypothetical protein
MIHPSSLIVSLGAAVLVAGCASTPGPGRAPARPGTAAQQGSAIIRVPEMMSARGLENIIGAGAPALTQRLGEPQLDGFEGDVRKLQFAGTSCVVDVYLYPLRPGAEPVATHVEARRRDGGAAVDQVQCLREVERR